MESIKTFEDSFLEFYYDREEQIGRTLATKNQKYQEIREKVIDLFVKLKALIPVESQKLLFDYESLENELSAIELQEQYLQGMKDCYNFLKQIGALGNG